MFNYFAKQRQAEREMFLQVIQEVMGQANKQTELIVEQTKLLSQLASFFDFSGDPRHRVMNDKREFDLEQAEIEASSPR